MASKKPTEDNTFLNFLNLVAVAIDALQGERGHKGETGLTGAVGADGKNSTVPGPAGKDGVDGLNGLNGLPGVDGLDGKDGLNGLDGASGEDGLDGKNGKDGADGKDGESVTPEVLIQVTTPIISQYVAKSVASKTPDTKLVMNYTVKTGDITIGPDDYVIHYTSGTHTATLPPATTNQGQQFVIKNSGTGIITLTGSETIDGYDNAELRKCDSLTVFSTGTDYIII